MNTLKTTIEGAGLTAHDSQFQANGTTCKECSYNKLEEKCLTIPFPRVIIVDMEPVQPNKALLISSKREKRQKAAQKMEKASLWELNRRLEELQLIESIISADQVSKIELLNVKTHYGYTAAEIARRLRRPERDIRRLCSEFGDPNEKINMSYDELFKLIQKDQYTAEEYLYVKDGGLKTASIWTL